jgi:putative DNA primase/helicase
MASRPAPSVSEVERAFAEAMQAEGFQPGPIQSDTKGFVRFDAPGDKAGKGNGFYKLRTGQYPVGWFGDWKQGSQHQWAFNEPGRQLSEAERKSIQREQRRLKAEAQVERETRQAEVAEDASRMWGKADGNVEGHPYLVRKQISVPRGLRIYTAKDGVRLLAVPMWSFDLNGVPKLTSLQLIGADGDKRFLKAGRVEGTFFSIKGDTSIIVICEGVATAFSIWEATGLSVVAAFNAGNLIEVVKEFARWRPHATLLIGADNDAIAPDDWAERGGGRPWINQGVKKAEAAAKVVGCRWIMPIFEAGERRDLTDFNDLHRAEGLDAVKRQVGGAFKTIEAEDAAPGATIVQFEQVQDESWRAKVPRTSSGTQDGANVEGVAIYIANHRLLCGRLRFNQLTKEMEIDGNPLQDYHVAEFRRIMHHDRLKAKKGDVQDEMEAEARRQSFDPLTDYLAGVKWDGMPRLSRWMVSYLGAPDTAYTRNVSRKSLIGAVARALDPGCKNDTMPVLEGEQGTGKSTALRYLFGDRFFIDNLPDFHSKDSFQQLQGAWCVEVAELAALTKAEVKDVKQFLSRLVDKFRPPYGRNPIQVPRRTVFWGTVNPEEGQGYLKDPTGGRRFWPVETTAIDLAAILLDRDQLWAEAVSGYTQGERWYLDDDEAIEEAREQQELRREVHPWEAVLKPWLLGRSTCTIADILSDCLKITADKQNPTFSRQAGSCLRALGWRSKTERPGPGLPPAKVFLSPSEQRERGTIPGAIGPQEDAPFL